MSLLPVELTSTYQFADISTAEKRVDGFNRLAIGMHRAGLRPGAFPWPPEGEPNRPLYRGLRMLEEPDAAIYFGRDTQITKALDTIRQMRDGSAERMLVILGASGAGKSSFLRAGLISRLKRDRGHFLVLPTLRPGRAALTGSAGLLNALSLDEPIDPASLSAHLADLRASALLSLQPHDEEPEPGAPLPAPTVVLPIDQAEELFVEGEKEAAEVIPLIAAMVAADPHLLVLLTIRSDSFERLQADQRLSEVSRRPFDLPRLSSSAFKEIIEGPAGLPGTGLAIDTDLTEQLLADFNGSDALPLLAFTLERLVADHGSDGRLEKHEYLDDMKGMGGAIHAAVERAFAQAADTDGLPHGRAELNELARQCFVPGLVLVDNEAMSPKRRIALRRELPEAALPLIDCLADQRLLVTDSTGRQPTVEVAHEAVLRHWRDLAVWVADRREDLLGLERVTAAADEWSWATGTGKEEALAHRGERLQAAEKLLGWDDLGWARDDYRVAYIAACRAAESRSVMHRRRVRRWIGGLVAAAAFVTVIGVLLVVHGQRNLGRSESVMLARAADRLVQEGDLPRATRLAILAAHENTLKPGSAYARATLASVALLNKLQREWRGHTGAVLGAVFSSDESKLLTWSADDTVRLWDTATGTQIGPALGHDFGGVRGAAFSADERVILSWSADKTARLWDAATGAPIGPALRHQRGVIGALFSPDQSRILTWDTSDSARLWDATSGAEVGPTLRHGGSINGAVFSSNGQRILTWSNDETARLWTTSSGAQIGAALQHEGSIGGARFSPDQRRILTWTRAGDARVWDAADGASITPALSHDASVMGARFSSGGRRVLTWGRDKSARLWDADSGEQIGPALLHEDRVVGAVFSPNERQVLTWASDKVARLWNTADGTRVGPALVHDGEIEEGKFSPDGKHILTWSDMKSARLWDAATGSPVPLAMTHDERLRGARFAAGGRRVLTWSDDATVRLWNVTGDDQAGPLFTHDGSVMGALFSSDGRHILSWSDDNTARLWDADSGIQIGPPLAHDRVVWGARFSRDERRILTWSLDGTARQWDAASGKLIGPPLTHEDAVLGAIFSPDERRILTWSKDGTARLWDAVSGARTGPALTHGDEVDGASFASDGHRILTWGKDKTVRQWDATTGTVLGPSLPHTYWPKGARFSSDARRILSWDAASARLWDAASGVRIGPELKHEGAVFGAAFSPDERRILTWSQDNTAQLWDVASGARSGPALRHDDEVRDGVFSSDGRRMLTWGHDNTARQWDASSGAQIGPVLKHQDDVTGAAFLPGERRILTWSLDGSARIWDAASGVRIGPALEGSVKGALPAPDGDRILTWNWRNSLRLWHVEGATRQQPVQTLVGQLCRDNLLGDSMAVDAYGLLAGVRHLDARDIEYAPILEGRVGEMVCAPAPTAWETLQDLFTATTK